VRAYQPTAADDSGYADIKEKWVEQSRLRIFREKSGNENGFELNKWIGV
jgi:hypothetical protein